MSATQPIIWVHGDVLSPHGPALAAYPGAPAIYVWDDELLERWQISTKRLVFIYECLLELPITIRRGDVAAEVAAFAQQHGARRVATAASPAPRFETIRRAIARSVPVEVLPVAPFFAYEGKLDLKRFSRYWGVAERYVFDLSRDQATRRRGDDAA